MQSCEIIRVSLEDCEVDKDIAYFIKEKGTGGDIPDPPKFIDFARGDDEDDSASELSENGYAESQYQRTINAPLRNASPQPSTYESHHDPRSELALRMGHDSQSAGSYDAHSIPRKQPNSPFNSRRGNQGIDEAGMATGKQRGIQLPPNYDPSQHGEIPSVPYNAYPTDGMTMFCRRGPPSERSSGTSGYRPSSRGSQGEISNPTSVSSQEPLSTKQSPTKPMDSEPPLPSTRAENQVQKKRSAFFSNSPFRRKSRHEKDRSAPTSQNTSPVKAPYSRQRTFDEDATNEAADPRANFQLNVGNNVFDVASPDADTTAWTPQAANEERDPIARALADLKGGSGKQSSSRVSADRYHGIMTPAPTAPAMATATPPPAYSDPSVKRLDAPQPAFTASQMQKTTQKYVGQGQSMLRGNDNAAASRMGVGSSVGPGQDMARSRSPFARRSASPQVYSPRAVSPRVPTTRAVSPQVSPVTERRMSQSPYQSNSMGNRYSQSSTTGPSPRQGYSPYEYSRNFSPQPQFRQQARPNSAGMVERNHMDSGYDGFRGQSNGASYYPDAGTQGVRRSRSRTLALADPGRQFSRDGRPILHFARAMYSYTAAIPEELGFSKGDSLAIIRLQDDGWWEAEVVGTRSHPGLVPSNYLQVH